MRVIKIKVAIGSINPNVIYLYRVLGPFSRASIREPLRNVWTTREAIAFYVAA